MLVLTFGFVLLTTDVAIGRKTKKNALRAFEALNPKWKFLGHLTFLVPALIMTYYSVIGGWIAKYFFIYVVSDGKEAAADGYFTSFITSDILVFIVYCFLLFRFSCTDVSAPLKSVSASVLFILVLHPARKTAIQIKR